jgi:HK97 family phage portal protein
VRKTFQVGGLKFTIPFPGLPWPNFPPRRTLAIGFRQGLPDERDYGRLVGDGSNNSIVGACLNWICRTFPEAPAALWTVDEEDVRSRIRRHPMLTLLRNPTASPGKPQGYYSGTLLWMATLLSWIIDGNAYWLKVRSRLKQVVQLWYVPHWMMEPWWPTDGSEYISHYMYWVNGNTVRIPSEDVVHFRFGLDPDNIRKGQSPLRTVLREVFTDEEGARFTASIMKNLGVPGLVVAPSASVGSQWRPNPTEIATMEARYKEKFIGDKRGEPIIMSGPTSVTPYGFSPRDMDLSALRNVPEERITAALGLPAAVVGFGAGLQQTKVGATMSELRDQAWQSCLIPNQRILGEEVQTQLLPDFEPKPESFQFGFDLSRVMVMQEQMLKAMEFWTRLGAAGFAKRSEVRRTFDLPVKPEDEVYVPQPGVQASSSSSSGGDATDLQRQIQALQGQIQDVQDQVSAA